LESRPSKPVPCAAHSAACKAASQHTSCRGIPSRTAASTPDTSSYPPEYKPTLTSRSWASVPPEHTAHSLRRERPEKAAQAAPPGGLSFPALEQPEAGPGVGPG